MAGFQDYLIPFNGVKVLSGNAAQRISSSEDIKIREILFTPGSNISETVTVAIRSSANGPNIVQKTEIITINALTTGRIQLDSDYELSSGQNIYIYIQISSINRAIQTLPYVISNDADITYSELGYGGVNPITLTIGDAPFAIGVSASVNESPERPVIQNVSSDSTSPTRIKNTDPTFTITTRDADDINDYGTEIENVNVVIDDLSGTNILNETKKISPIYPNSVLTDPTHGLMLSDVGGAPTGWSAVAASNQSVSNRVARFTATAQFGREEILCPTIVGKEYYVRNHINATTTNAILTIVSGASFGAHSGSGLFEAITGVFTATSSTTNIATLDLSSVGWTEIEHTQFAIVNMTDDYPGYTKAEMDELPFDVLRNLVGVDGNFENGQGSWVEQNVTNTSYNDNVATFTPTAQFGLINYNVSTTIGHDYLYFADVKSESSETAIVAPGVDVDHSGDSSFELLALEYTSTLASVNFSIYSKLSSGWSEIQAKRIGIFDTTQAFGAGQEPTLSQLKNLVNFTTGVQFDTQKTTTALTHGETYDVTIRVQDDDSKFSDFSDSAYIFPLFRQRIQLSSNVTTTDGQRLLIPSQYMPQQNTIDFTFDSFAENDYIQYILSGLNTDTANIKVTSKSTTMDGLTYTLPL